MLLEVVSVDRRTITLRVSPAPVPMTLAQIAEMLIPYLQEVKPCAPIQ
jgi:Trm5-related predicted tRNA methylase